MGSVTIALSETFVHPGDQVTVYGKVAAADGTAIADETVWLLERTPGEAGVAEVASAQTDSSGDVVIAAPAATRSVRLSLLTDDQTRSTVVSVVLLPALTATVDLQGTTDWLDVTALGGQPGDSVTVEQRVGGAWQLVATSQLDGALDATFGVPQPVGGAPQHYRIVLPRTSAHAAATARLTLPPA